MDESTSALDNETEDIIMNNLNEKFKNKTFIMIAHRKSTIDKCDRIGKLNQGKLIF
jgi:ABC-type bacteriocin/lantibiotic exporter with double-glycine peptidase domain